MTPIACSRMYNVNSDVAQKWEALFAAVSQRANVPVQVVRYPPPQPLDDLWARPDMALVFMCGWPFSRAVPQPVAVAAPVPSDARAGGKPIYWSDMIVRADSPFRTLEDTFGHRIAWTVTGSHSGYNAPRRLLMDHAARSIGPLFSATVGNVISPGGAIDAVLTGQADVAPLDGFYHLLLKRHDPALAARLRVVARTPPAPIPLLVASRDVAVDRVDALRKMLLSAHADQEIARLLEDLCIARFVAVPKGDYALGDRWEADAIAAGYPEIA